MTVVVCQEKEKHLGTKQAGPDYQITYELINNGMEDLYIDRVSTSCGCTVSSFTRSAVKPNESTLVTLEFSSANRSGLHKKTATVSGNFEPAVSLSFSIELV